MNFDLSDEHRMLQETVRAFVAKEVAPRARHVDESGEFPWETLHAMAKLGLLGLNVPEAFGGSGADYLSVALDAGRDRQGVWLDRADRCRAPGPGVRAAHPVRHERAEATLARADGTGEDPRLPGADRAGRGLRPTKYPLDRGTRRGVMGHQRQQDVADQRRGGRDGDLARAHRREVQPHYCPHRHPRHQLRPAGEENGAARLAHLRGQPGGRAGAGRKPAGGRGPRPGSDPPGVGRRPDRDRQPESGIGRGRVRRRAPTPRPVTLSASR